MVFIQEFWKNLRVVHLSAKVHELSLKPATIKEDWNVAKVIVPLLKQKK